MKITLGHVTIFTGHVTTALPSKHVFIWLPCEQLVGYRGQEYIPGTVAHLVPSVGEKLTTNGHSKVLKAVSPTACQLLIIWNGKNDRR